MYEKFGDGLVLENYKIRSFPIKSDAVREIKILQYWLDSNPLNPNFDQSCLGNWNNVFLFSNERIETIKNLFFACTK